MGDSEEFVALRDYRPGDPLKRIHWRTWARIGRPVVREYQDEFFVRHALVFDTFLSAPTPAFEEAVSVAASFACTVGTQESLLDLLFVGPRPTVSPPGAASARRPPAGDPGRRATLSRSALRHAVAARARAPAPGVGSHLRAAGLGRRASRARRASARAGVPTLVLLVTDGSVTDTPPTCIASRSGAWPRTCCGSDAPSVLGVALVFWGWETGLLPVGIVMAVVLEARMFMHSRWDLGRSDFNRVSDLSAVLLVVMAVYAAVGQRDGAGGDRSSSGCRWCSSADRLSALQRGGPRRHGGVLLVHARAASHGARGRPHARLFPASPIGQHCERALDVLRLGLVGIAAWALWPARGPESRAGSAPSRWPRGRLGPGTSRWPRPSARSSAVRRCGC